MITRKSDPGQKLMTRMKSEVEQTLKHFQEMTGRDFMITEESMMRVLQSFLLYRPDFGYSQVRPNTLLTQSRTCATWWECF